MDPTRPSDGRRRISPASMQPAEPHPSTPIRSRSIASLRTMAPADRTSGSTQQRDGPNKRPVAARWPQRRLAVIVILSGSFLLLFLYFGATGSSHGRPHNPHSRPHRPHKPSEPTITPPPLVTLPGYGSFQGTQLVATLARKQRLRKPVDAWVGVEYATQPVGRERFKTVGWPKRFEGTKDVTKPLVAACFQNLRSVLEQSEACLTINVYRPSGIAMDQRLPVFVFLHGGSFVIGSHRSFDGALFVANSPQPLMVVTAQYRLGALGSLPGAFMEADGLLNLGLQDQKQMLEFLQKHIEHFGGHPGRITLGGQSAGGHSVGIHLFHDYGNSAGKPLFHQVILSSGSPTARAFPGTNSTLYQAQVQELMDYVHCPTAPTSAALECLRSAEVEDIQTISTSIYREHDHNITWPWQPASPGPLLEKRGSTSGEDGTIFKIPMLISSTTDEGASFVPQNLYTNDDYLTFWKTLAPGLTSDDLADLQTLYPELPSNSNKSHTPRTKKVISPQFPRFATAYGDFSYICFVQDTASRLSSAGAPVYKTRFNTPNYAPSYLGVPHASDGVYYNGNPNAQYPEIAAMYSSYWASFIVSGDPNTYARAGAPTWKEYKAEGGRQLVVNPDGPKMEDERDGVRMEQCRWWRDAERMKRLNK